MSVVAADSDLSGTPRKCNEPDIGLPTSLFMLPSSVKQSVWRAPSTAVVVNTEPSFAPVQSPQQFSAAADFSPLGQAIRALVELSTMQGYLTLDDLYDALPDNEPGTLDILTGRLRALQVAIVQSPKEPSPDDALETLSGGVEKERTASGEHCDSVRRYLNEMGRLSVITPEQERDTFQRIEEAELNLLRHLDRFGLTADAYLDTAKKLLNGSKRLDSIVPDKHLENKETYLTQLPALCAQVEQLAASCHTAYRSGVTAVERMGASVAFADFNSKLSALRGLYPRFLFRHKIIESFVDRVDEVYNLVSLWSDDLDDAKHRDGHQRGKGSSPCALHSSAVDRRAALEDVLTRNWLNREEFLEEHRQLHRCLKDSRAAKGEMVQANLRIVVSMAKRYTACGQPLLDLIQEGNIGVLKAVERFEYRRGFKFSTYASWWIRQSITRLIADQSRTIRIPIYMIGTIGKLMRVQKQLMQDLGRDPTPDEVAEEINLPVERVRALLRMAEQPISLHSPSGESGSACFGDSIPDQSAEDPAETTAFNMLKVKILDVLTTLTERERQVLEQRYGLKDGQTRTLDEIGRQFQLTRERIRQIEAKALRKMRHPTRIRQLESVFRASEEPAV